MKLVLSRRHRIIDRQTLTESFARDALFRTDDGSFLLYTASERRVGREERILILDCRDALVWLNETPDELGSYWHLAGSEHQSYPSTFASLTSKANRR
jgi:hypothetical protein